MWIKLHEDGDECWINTHQVRRLEIDEQGKSCTIVFTTQDKVEVDEPAAEVLLAMGYNPTPRPPLETHDPEEDSEDDSDFVGAP